MAKKATAITIAFKDLLGQFDYKKTFYTSNPVRKETFMGTTEKALQFFKLDLGLKTILIFGGGTGAQAINQIVLETLGKLTAKYQVIHFTGKDKGISKQLPDYYDHLTLKRINEHYHAYEFLDAAIFDAMSIADLVVSRAGLSSLTELSVLGKAAILIPLPGHQELNAQYYLKFNAVKVIKQPDLNNEVFVSAIETLLANPADLQTLSRNILQMIDKDAAKKYVDLIYQALS
jgi:UDP-N-acetylglucosamine--N-acetylmuramyl-(pentapeptide) pyrophosphoryl-undecaprenol N-acetylglucosamine transferase